MAKWEGIKSWKRANRVNKKDLYAGVALIELDKKESIADVEWVSRNQVQMFEI